MRWRRDAATMCSSRAWAPPPSGPNPSTVGTPRLPSMLVSPAPAAGRPSSRCPSVAAVAESCASSAASAADACQAGLLLSVATSTRHAAATRPDAANCREHAGLCLAVDEAKADLRVRRLWHDIGAGPAGDHPDIAEHRGGQEWVIGDLADASELVDELVDRRDAQFRVQCRMRAASVCTHGEPRAASTADLQGAVGVGGLEADRAHGVGRLRAYELAAGGGADLLVAVQDDTYGAAWVAAKSLQGRADHHDAALHVVHSGPADDPVLGPRQCGFQGAAGQTVSVWPTRMSGRPGPAKSATMFVPASVRASRTRRAEALDDGRGDPLARRGVQ